MKREFLLFLIIFGLGVVATYCYSTKSAKAKLAANKEVTLNIIDNCTATFQVQDELVKNRNKALNEIGACIVDENCNPDQTIRRLRELNQEKDEIELELKDLVKHMDFIIGQKTKLLPSKSL